MVYSSLSTDHYLQLLIPWTNARHDILAHPLLLLSPNPINLFCNLALRVWLLSATPSTVSPSRDQRPPREE